jgi:hypothetical protein
MEELYLIAHQVRGEVAYDVAQRLLLSNGRPLWLIPTTGHQAYPLRWMKLDESLALTVSAEELAGVRDHYAYLEERKLRARLRAWLTRVRMRMRGEVSVADAIAQLLERSLSGKG